MKFAITKPPPLDFMDEEGLFEEEHQQARIKGLHLSQIIAFMQLAIYGKPLEFNNELYREMGMMWEARMKRRGGSELVVYQKTVVLDGIHMSPDGRRYGKQKRLEEYKATWRSMKKLSAFEQEFWTWLVQTKGYCLALGLSSVLFDILFVNGDYGEERGPQRRQVSIEYSPLELKMNWTAVLNNAKAMARKGIPEARAWAKREGVEL